MLGKTIGIVSIIAFVIGGCSGMRVEPTHKAPTNDYEKAILQHHKALEDQKRTMLNMYRT